VLRAHLIKVFPRATIARAPVLWAVAALSLLVFVAAVVVWVRSHFVRDIVIWRRSQGDSWITGACKGQIQFGHSRYPGLQERRGAERPGLVWYQAPPWPMDSRSFLDPCHPIVSWGGPYKPPYSHHTHFDRAGFAYQRGLKHLVDERGRTLSTVVSSRILLVPCWSLALASAAAPAVWLGRGILRRRRSRPGSGFDVTPPASETGTGPG
jgi:hypothetical protein